MANLFRILLVEDDARDADLVRTYLDGSCTIMRATSLAGARVLAREHVFDAALVDASLPDAQGVTALEVLAATGLFPVILLTGMDSASLADDAARAGAQEYLIKGQFTQRQLLRAISFVVTRHEGLMHYSTLLHEIPDGVVIVSHTGEVLFANPAANSMVMPFEGRLIASDLGFLSRAGTVTQTCTEDGLVIEMRATQLRRRGSPVFIVFVRDVTDRVRMVRELSEANRKLEEVAVLDPLTGVLNRRGIEAELLQLVKTSRRTGELGAALLIDCDDFKGINDASGYRVGDATLQLLAGTIVESLRPALDRVGRIGGDEFLVLLPHTTRGEAFFVAERLRMAIRARPLPVVGPRNRHAVTVSVGVTAVPPTTASLTEIIALAEAPLLACKRNGKDRGAVAGGADASLAAPTTPELLRADEIRVARQPIVTLVSQATSGCELLMRGTVGALESPKAYFSSAEHNNVLIAADLLCLRRCVAAAMDLTADVRVHLNIFPSTLVDTPISVLLELLVRSGSPKLVLELSEQEFIGDPARLLPSVVALRNAGIAIALDDVGFGRSSLEALLVLEPNYVKIDRALVTGVGTDHAKRRVLNRLLACLGGLRSEVIAEGIETEADRRALVDLGILFGQGFLWGKPEIIAADRRPVA